LPASWASSGDDVPYPPASPVHTAVCYLRRARGSKT
jgi:hypothetical protein